MNEFLEVEWGIGCQVYSIKYKGRRAEAENGVVLLSVRYGTPYDLYVGQNVRRRFRRRFRT